LPASLTTWVRRACIAEISEHLRHNNPEWLYMAAKRAGDVGDARRIMGGFCTSNPELLQMVHDFASEHDNYAGIIERFALLYAALLEQSTADGFSVHRESIKNRPGP
jgi:hypothetical protein